MDFKYHIRKGFGSICFIIIGLVFMMPTLNGQHNWQFNVNDYDYDGQLTAVVIINTSEVISGTLGAFVGDECRGYIDGSSPPSTDNIVFTLMCYSNMAAGEMLTFRYYDNVNDKYYSIEEAQEFTASMILRNADSPLQFHGVSNAAPIVNCPDYSGISGHPGTLEFNLCDIFIDPDGDELTYDVTINPQSSYQLNGCVLQFDAATSGTSTITITASDGEFSESCNYSFTVDAVNGPPVANNPIEVLRLKEGYISHEIDLDTIFSDPNGDAMSYSAKSANEKVVTVSVSGSILTLNELNPGNAVVTLTANDGSLSAEMSFNVIAVSAGPELPWGFHYEDFLYNGQVDGVVLVNSDELTSGILGAFVGNECRGIVEGTYFPPTDRIIFSLICYSNESSGELLTFKYYNPIDKVIYDIDEYIEFKSNMRLGDAIFPYEFNFRSENNVPTVDNPIPDQELDEHYESLQFDLTAIFSDMDGDELSYYAVITDTSVAQLNLEGTMLSIEEKKPGNAVITLSASDGALSIDDLFKFSVTDINDPPVIANPLDDIDLVEGFRSVAVDISKVFEDPENDQLSYSARSLGTGIVTVWMDETNLNIREVSLGSTTISICASDGEHQTCQSVKVSVIEKNYPPEIDCNAIPDTSFVAGFGSYTMNDLCSAFYDEDLDPLAFITTSSNISAATVAFVGCDLVVSEVGLGTTTIKVCASDGKALTCCSFEFSVLRENMIVLRYDGDVISEDDSIKICSDASDFIINVQSDVTWGFITYSDWIQHEVIDNSTLKISCPENSTGEWRMGLAKVLDNQDHEALFYVFQAKDCVHNNVDEKKLNEVFYYPNPVDEILNIHTENLELAAKTKIFITDISGRNVLIEELVYSDGNKVQIDMTGLRSGIYFMRFFDLSGVQFELPVVKK